MITSICSSVTNENQLDALASTPSDKINRRNQNTISTFPAILPSPVSMCKSYIGEVPYILHDKTKLKWNWHVDPHFNYVVPIVLLNLSH